MPKLSEIINEMQDDVKVQFLNESMVSIKDKKRTSDTEITFATSEVDANEWCNDKKTAVIVWVDKEKYNQAIINLTNNKE